MGKNVLILGGYGGVGQALADLKAMGAQIQESYS